MEFTKDEFFAYLLLCAADANAVVSSEEKEYILSKVPEDTYANVYKIFKKENDKERIDRIVQNVKAGNYHQSSPYELIEEIKTTMTIDGRLDAAETMFLIGIRRLLRSI